MSSISSSMDDVTLWMKELSELSESLLLVLLSPSSNSDCPIWEVLSYLQLSVWHVAESDYPTYSDDSIVFHKTLL